MAKKDLTKIPNYNNVYKGAEYYSFSDNLDKQAKADKWFELFRTNQKDRPLTKNEFDEFMNLSKELAWEDFGKGGVVTYKDKYNTKYGYKKNESHTLEEISKDTGVSIKGLQQIYNKGIGAYKTNPTSVRPNVKSKEQWAMARVYSSVMGGKASKIDANELKMEKGGSVQDLINQGVLDLKMFDTTPEHAKLYGFDSVNPLYIKSIHIIESERLKGKGTQVLKYIDDYAIENGHDVVFGHITQKSEPSIDLIKS
jgi:hypothetical protein